MLGGMIGRLFAVAAFWLALAAPAAQAQSVSVRANTVVELYTSQGCGQCVRANRLIGMFGREDHLLALTFPVSVWDYLGWQDTFAQPNYTTRHRTYTSSLHARRFTPQLVFNGANQMSAANWDEVRAVLDDTKAQALPGPDITIARPRAGRVRVAIGSSAHRSTPADVWLIAYEPGPVSVDVYAGANRNRRVDHYNLVRWIDRAATWRGAAMYVERSRCSPRCAVILQEPNGGRILAAAYTGTSER